MNSQISKTTSNTYLKLKVYKRSYNFMSTKNIWLENRTLEHIDWTPNKDP